MEGYQIVIYIKLPNGFEMSWKQVERNNNNTKTNTAGNLSRSSCVTLSCRLLMMGFKRGTLRKSKITMMVQISLPLLLVPRFFFKAGFINGTYNNKFEWCRAGCKCGCKALIWKVKLNISAGGRAQHKCVNFVPVEAIVDDEVRGNSFVFPVFIVPVSINSPVGEFCDPFFNLSTTSVMGAERVVVKWRHGFCF